MAAFLAAGVFIWLGIGGGRGIGDAMGNHRVARRRCRFYATVANVVERALTDSPPDSLRREFLGRSGDCNPLGGLFHPYRILGRYRDLFPKTHDDCSYMIQMQMLARGRLWMRGCRCRIFLTHSI